MSNYDVNYDGSTNNPTSSMILFFGQSGDGSDTIGVHAVECDPFNDKLNTYSVFVYDNDIPKYRKKSVCNICQDWKQYFYFCAHWRLP